ncbi:MAG: HlyC/CorC family transporter [Alphaproteobacteria bacterium]
MSLTLALTMGAILILLILSGFFSGSETALTATSRARIHQLAQQGNKRAKGVEKLIQDQERLIGAILLGNNLVNILASALATSMFLNLFGDSGVAYATLIMTALVVIFAEVMPKTYAIQNPDRGALAVAPIIRIIVLVFTPFVWLVQKLVSGVFRLFGRNVGSEWTGSALEEIRGAIDLHHSEGRVKKGYRDMLGSILDLRDLDVGEVMTHRRNMFMINADDSGEKILDAVINSPFTRIPLYKDEQENIIGVFHAKDVLRAVAALPADKSDETLKAALLDIAAEPWFVPETRGLNQQLESFKRRHAHFAIVIDEYGTLMGVLTLEDIIEEIVGDISDEHDHVVEGVRPQDNGSFLVDGIVTIRDLNRELDWRLPDDEATTIAGLVIHEARTIPEVGQAFNFHGFTFEVLKRQRNQITLLRVAPARHKTGE